LILNVRLGEDHKDILTAYAKLSKAVKWLEKADFEVKIVVAGTTNTRRSLWASD